MITEIIVSVTAGYLTGFSSGYYARGKKDVKKPAVGQCPHCLLGDSFRVKSRKPTLRLICRECGKSFVAKKIVPPPKAERFSCLKNLLGRRPRENRRNSRPKAVNS